MNRHFVSRRILVAAAALFWAIPPVAAQQPGSDRAARIREEAAKPTPHLADGHPDLTGYWADRIETGFGYNIPVTKSGDGKTVVYHDADAPELDARAQPRFKARAADAKQRPQYKPQFQKKQKELMYTASRIDPGIHCYPFGVPRIGAPTEIVHTPTTLYFFYGGESDEDPTHTFRVIPIGGKHDPDRDPRPDGDSIAQWDGDTLVVDVVNIDPETWLDGDGDFHDENLHVIERITRKGNTLDYNVIVEDPTLFTEAWRPVANGIGVLGRTGSTTRILRPAGEHAPPDFPCVERDRDHKVNNDRF